MRNRWWIAPAAAGAVALVAACGSSPGPPASGSSPSTSASASTATSATVITTASTKDGTVLVNAKGRTLYWFAIDTPTKSNCTGSCTSYWPPVLGTAAAAAGVSLLHGFGTITRSNGQQQATYDGHPLYTYSGDSAPGQVNGNGLNLSGGLWWAMTPSGAKPAASPSPSSSTSGGGGYGY